MINDAIQKAIKDNLPAAVAGELATFIEQANKDARVLNNQEADIRVLQQSIKSKDEEILQIRILLNKYSDWEKREAAVLAAQNKLEVTLAEKDKAAAENALSKIYTLTEIAFRNPRIVHSEFSSRQENYMSPGNSYPLQATLNDSKNITVEEMK